MFFSSFQNHFRFPSIHFLIVAYRHFIINGIRNFIAQQAQPKQLILTNNKDTFTYCFQPIQCLQPNFMPNGIKKFMYTKHKGDNAKLKIFSFLLQRQYIQPNFVSDGIKLSYIPKATKHTNIKQATKAITSTLVLLLTQSLCFYNWKNANPGVFRFQFRKKPNNFVHIIHQQFLHFIDPEKPVLCLLSNFEHTIHHQFVLFIDFKKKLYLAC